MFVLQHTICNLHNEILLIRIYNVSIRYYIFCGDRESSPAV